MRCLILALMILFFRLASACAQDPYQYGRIDFFNERTATDEPGQTETKINPEPVVDEWAEPIVSPSGQVSVYVPPKEVRDFLEKPNQENAKAYLAWNLKRIDKFILAQQLLTKEAKGLGYMNETKNSADIGSSAPDNTRIRVNYLFYFMLKGCPVCARQAEVIEDIYLHHPEIRIEGFAKGYSDRELEQFRFSARQDNGMSDLFKINSYPAIVLFNNKREKYFLSGYVNEERILKLFE
jgi:thioredoxin-related protein